MATYGPTAVARDTLLQEQVPTNNWGASTILQISWGTTGVRINTALAWDVSSIPMGDTIVSASIVLSFQSEQLSTDRAGTIYPCTRLIVEGTGNGSATGDGATWNTYDGSNNWTAPGGDIDASFGSAFTLTNSTADITIDATTAVAKALADYRSGNFITLIARQDVDLVSSSEYWRGDGRTVTAATLTVEHTTPAPAGPPEGSMMLLGVGR